MKMLTPFRRRNLGLTETNPFDQWMREFFDNGTHADNRLETRFLPVANIAETDKEWVVSMELPGMNEKEVDVRLNGNQLVVTGDGAQRQAAIRARLDAGADRVVLCPTPGARFAEMIEIVGAAGAAVEETL